MSEMSEVGPVPAVTRWLPPGLLRDQHEAWLVPIDLRGDLVARGWSDKAIRRQVRTGHLVRHRWGAYSDGSACAGLDLRGHHALRSRAVLMQGAAEMSLSHASALIWYGAPEWGLDLSEVQVTRHDGRAGRREGGIRQHRGSVVDGDIVEMDGVRLTSPTRAALELTLVADVETSLVHVNHLLHAGLTTTERLWARYEQMREWPGSLTTELVLRLADARIESVLESRFFHLCFRYSIPLPVPQYVVTDLDGVVVARLDFAWPDLGRFVECDGRVKYEKLLRPGERAGDVVVREKERDKLVHRLTGMEGDRYVWADVEHPARTAARLRRFLSRD